MRKKYSTDLTDKQWEEIKPLLVGMRNRKWSKRDLIDSVFYLVDTGCKWRQLPHDFPPAFTVHSFYRRAKLSGRKGQNFAAYGKSDAEKCRS